MRFASNSTPLTRQHWWLVIVLSGFALILAHGVALLYQVQPGISLWFFPSGVAIALTLCFEWIGLILTGITSLVIAPFWGSGDWTGWLRITDIIIPLITWLLYRRLWQGSLSLKRFADAVVFISATLAACTTSATVHSLGLLAWGKIPPSTLLQNLSYNWLGQAMGILAVAPTALLILTRFWQNRGWLPNSDQKSSSVWSLWLHQWLEILALGCLSIGIATLTVWATFDSGLTFERLLFIGFLPILWAAIRFGAMGGMLLVSFSIAVTGLDYLIFYPSALSLSPLPISADILSLHQLSLLTQGIVSLLLGAAIAQPETVTAKPAAYSDYPTRAQLNALLTKAYTRLQEFNQKLRQSEERFRTSVESMLDCFGIYTAIRDESGEIVDFRIDYVNAAACRDNFLSKQQIGQSLCQLLPAHRETGLFAEYSQVVETGEPLIKESLIYEDNFAQQRLRRAYDIRATKLGDGFIATWRDITEGKQVEAERQHLAHQVQQQVGLLQGILSASVDQIYLYDRHGKYLYVSVSAAKALGRQPSDMVGKTWQELGLPATVMESYDAQRQVVFETGQSLTDEINLPTVQGIRQYEYILSPVANAEGTIETVVATVRDITDRKQAEVQLQEREELFRTSVETMLDCFGIYSAIRDESGEVIDFRIDYVNTAVCTNNGLSQNQQIGRGLCEILPAHQETGLFADYCQVVETRQPLVKESVAYEDNYGQQRLSRVFDICIAPFRDGFIATWRDVTERQQTQAELYRRQQEFQALVENSPDIICRFDQDLRFMYVNPAIEAVTGLSRQSFLGKTYQELGIPEPISTHGQTTLREIFATGQEQIPEFNFLTPDNTTRYYQARMVPELAEDGIVESILAIARDITDLKLAEAERNQLLVREQEARSVAEAANRTKDEFLAIVSHELRSPLNAILGWAQLLRIRQLDAQKTNRALETIERNAQAQAQLIDDLLDISRIIRGQIRLNICPTNLVGVIEAALDTVHPLATDKQIQIDSRLNASGGWVSGDPNRLQQVIWNLLSNAVKFTPEGGRVEIHLEPVDQFAQIRVKDTGKGINPEFLPHIFESFRQADSTTARKQTGLGLGLAIAQNLVKLQGGTIHAESPGEGQGATFIVKLPLLDDDNKKMNAHDGIDSSLNFDASLLSRIRVLVVDDDADTREFLIALLEQYGAMVTATASATEALERLQQMKYDLLLSDIGMPGENGYRLIRQIRALPLAQGGQMQAVAVTAYAREEDRMQALSAGFQMHISKPIEPRQLLKVIVRLAGRTASTRDFLN